MAGSILCGHTFLIWQAREAARRHKILLDAADYPLAKMLLSTIREDANVDEHQLMATMLKQLPSYQVRKTAPPVCTCPARHSPV